MQKFKITCMKCGSDNCEIDYDVELDYDYNWDEEYEISGLQDNGLTITCLDCGNRYNTFDVYDEHI